MLQPTPEHAARAAILYGSTTGSTAGAAGLIAEAFRRRTGLVLPRFDIADVPLGMLCDRPPSRPEPRGAHPDTPATPRHRVLLLGCPTWDWGDLQTDWAVAIDDLDALDLRGVRVAVFGAGDAGAYPGTFADALGILADHAEARGATLVGAWPTAAYPPVSSRALRGGSFVGLPLDEADPDRTPQRILGWVARLARELGFPEPPSAS